MLWEIGIRIGRYSLARQEQTCSEQGTSLARIAEGADCSVLRNLRWCGTAFYSYKNEKTILNSGVFA